MSKSGISCLKIYIITNMAAKGRFQHSENSFPLIFIIFMLSFCNTHIKAKEPQLYKRSDPMTLLNNNTIMNKLVGNDKVWIVEFYSSWCGHCQSFAPKWIRLSWELASWDKYVNVGVIDCAVERNYDSCRAFEIEQYPTIKFFDIGWKNKTTQQKKTLGKTYIGLKDVKNIRRGLIDHIASQTDIGFNKIDIPFQFIGMEAVNSFMIREKATSYRYLALLFEKADSYTGKVLIMDTSKCSKLAVRRVADTNKELGAKYAVTVFPALVLITLVDGKFKELSPGNRTHGSFLSTLDQITNIVRKVPVKAESTDRPIVDENEISQAKNSYSEVNMQDLISGVSFALRREIPKKEIIKGAALIALKDFVELLSMCLPAEKHLESFVKSLNNWLQLDPHQTSLRSADYLKYLSSHQEWDSYLPVSVDWKNCKGSKPRYRGFPCSLWTLFHALTVRCGTATQSDLTGFQVVNRLRKFVDHFFGCSYCREHFLEMSKNIESEILNHEDSVLWLWKGHNKVNARLKDDLSTDPLFPKFQFPPEYMCKECRKETTFENTIKTAPGYGVESINWNRRVVLQFLREHYGPDNIRIRDSPKEVIDVDSDNTDAVRRRFSYIFYPRTASPRSFSVVGLSNVDMSFCVFIYGTVIATVISLYIYFIRRRKKKMYKSYV